MTVGIYKKQNELFFTPFSKVRGGSKVMSNPILTMSYDEDEYVIGEKLHLSFSNCTELDSVNDKTAFKELLKISNSKSHKEFIEKTKFIKATINRDELKFILIGADIKKKAFMVKTNIEPIILNISEANNFEIGKSIKFLFHQSEITAE